MSNEMLDKEIKRLFEDLEALKPGTKEYMDVQDCLNVLYKLKTEAEKIVKMLRFSVRRTKTIKIIRIGILT